MPRNYKAFEQSRNQRFEAERNAGSLMIAVCAVVVCVIVFVLEVVYGAFDHV